MQVEMKANIVVVAVLLMLLLFFFFFVFFFFCRRIRYFHMPCTFCLDSVTSSSSFCCCGLFYFTLTYVSKNSFVKIKHHNRDYDAWSV